MSGRYDRSAVIAELSAETDQPLNVVAAILDAITRLQIKPGAWAESGTKPTQAWVRLTATPSLLTHRIPCPDSHSLPAIPHDPHAWSWTLDPHGFLWCLGITAGPAALATEG